MVTKLVVFHFSLSLSLRSPVSPIDREMTGGINKAKEEESNAIIIQSDRTLNACNLVYAFSIGTRPYTTVIEYRVHIYIKK